MSSYQDKTDFYALQEANSHANIDRIQCSVPTVIRINILETITDHPVYIERRVVENVDFYIKESLKSERK